MPIFKLSWKSEGRGRRGKERLISTELSKGAEAELSKASETMDIRRNFLDRGLRAHVLYRKSDFQKWGLDMATIGYARVSTNGQDLALQQEALKAAGCAKIYAEKMSGARSDRPRLARMLKALASGDTVIITRLDRLARSTLDLLNTVDAINKAGAGFRSLADAWADTTTPHGKLMLTVLGGLAEFERSLIMARTQDGIRRARERGATFGRPTKLNPKQRKMIAERYAAGETAAALAREFEVGEATVWRALNGE
jgi:DNA invertase Pin-like site-specific DNA recombinase